MYSTYCLYNLRVQRPTVRGRARPPSVSISLLRVYLCNVSMLLLYATAHRDVRCHKRYLFMFGCWFVFARGLVVLPSIWSFVLVRSTLVIQIQLSAAGWELDMVDMVGSEWIVRSQRRPVKTRLPPVVAEPQTLANQLWLTTQLTCDGLIGCICPIGENSSQAFDRDQPCLLGSYNLEGA